MIEEDLDSPTPSPRPSPLAPRLLLAYPAQHYVHREELVLDILCTDEALDGALYCCLMLVSRIDNSFNSKGKAS